MNPMGFWAEKPGHNDARNLACHMGLLEISGSLSPSVSVCLGLSASVCVCLHLSLSLSLSLSVCVSLSLSLCLSVRPSVVRPSPSPSPSEDLWGSWFPDCGGIHQRLESPKKSVSR